MLADFCHEFRAELMKDFNLGDVCPRCCITYIDGWCEEACRYEPVGDYSSKDDSDSDVEPSYELVCIFDYDDTPLKTVVGLWLEKLLEMCEEDKVLKEKWCGLVAKKLEGL